MRTRRVVMPLVAAAVLGLTGATVLATQGNAAQPAGSAVAAHPDHGHQPGRDDSVLTVVATFEQIAPADRQEFLTAAQSEAFESLHLEKGTLSYHVVPNPTDPTQVVFVATFTDADAYATHRADWPAKNFLVLVAKDHIVGPNIFIDNMSVPNVG